MSEEEGLKLVVTAIRGGIFNDLGSGGNVNICIIRNNGDVTYTEGYQRPNEKDVLVARINLPPSAFRFPRGTTPVLHEILTTFDEENVE